MSTAIVDYGMGNLDSVARAVEECGGNPVVTGDPGELSSAAHIILPGVGSFSDGMSELRGRGLDTVLAAEAGKRIPLLGICLGMQLLATTGHEGGETPGLGLIPGEVARLQATGTGTRIPHVGWNEVRPTRPCPLFEGIAPGKDFYFVHSFHFQCREPDDEAARTPYCGGFTSCVQRGSVFGVQFHPEKSQKPGLALLANFLALGMGS